MGLDAVELVMAVEDAFGIQIDDAQAFQLVTPRLLIDYVYGKVPTTAATAATAATVCLTQRAFNLLRKSLVRQGGWKRSDITPTTPLDALIPRHQRRSLLASVMTELAIKRPPDLVRHYWVNAVLLGSTVLAGLAAAIAIIHAFDFLAFLVFIGGAILAGVIGIRLTKPLCIEFPNELQTIGDLARWVMTHKSDLANAIIAGWTRDQVAARVRELIVEQLGVPPDFSEDANFVRDLGVD